MQFLDVVTAPNYFERATFITNTFGPALCEEGVMLMFKKMHDLQAVILINLTRV